MYSGVDLTWWVWFKAASVPSLISLALLPAVLFYLYPPKCVSTAQARQLAREKLEKMGG